MMPERLTRTTRLIALLSLWAPAPLAAQDEGAAAPLSEETAVAAPPAGADTAAPPNAADATGPRREMAPAAPMASAGLALGMADAMAHLREGRWTEALNAAQTAGPVARDVIEWHRLRNGLGTFDEVLGFLRRRPDWPGMDYLRKQSEESLPLSTRGAEVVGFFQGDLPETAHGVLALVNAYDQIGAKADAEALAALAWLERPMDAATEAVLIDGYESVLAPLHAERLDAMLWLGATRAATRALARVDGPEARLAEARLAVMRDENGMGAKIDAVPVALADHPGLAHARFEWRLGKNRRADALEMLLKSSTSAEGLGRPEEWSRPRRDLGRDLMREGDHETAYAVASSHWLSPEAGDFADLEWLSGYLALTFLDQPERAVEHFRRFRSSIASPISMGRAGYWEGRALEALGQEAAAREAYAIGAKYQTSFYGLLAAEKLGQSLDPTLAGTERYPAVRDSAFRDSTVLEAGLLLQAAGERDLAERFLTHLAESLDRTEAGSLADLALRLGEPHIALLIAKRVAQRGIEIPRAYYPVVELGVDDLPVARELALSIARRESEFDPGVSSGVGARGLMQVMPGTARDVARELNLPYSAERLFTDPTYNATLGSAYLDGLIRRFGNNPILVSAGYNAGPGRPLQWMRARGDPRRADVDMIDWIEHIPFDETRNYVMRVAESLPVYRARLAGEAPSGPIRFLDEISGQ